MSKSVISLIFMANKSINYQIIKFFSFVLVQNYLQPIHYNFFFCFSSKLFSTNISMQQLYPIFKNVPDLKMFLIFVCEADLLPLMLCFSVLSTLNKIMTWWLGYFVKWWHDDMMIWHDDMKLGRRLTVCDVCFAG